MSEATATPPEDTKSLTPAVDAPAAKTAAAKAPAKAAAKQPPKLIDPALPPEAGSPLAVPKGKVRVMILAHVGQYKPGQVADVSETEAGYMCEVRNRNDGHGLIAYQVAMKIEDWNAIKAKPVDKGGLTQGELSDMGLKFTVETPKDPAFEAHLARINKANEDKAKKKENDQVAARKKVSQKQNALKDPAQETA